MLVAFKVQSKFENTCERALARGTQVENPKS